MNYTNKKKVNKKGVHFDDMSPPFLLHLAKRHGIPYLQHS